MKIHPIVGAEILEQVPGLVAGLAEAVTSQIDELIAERKAANPACISALNVRANAQAREYHDRYLP